MRAQKASSLSPAILATLPEELAEFLSRNTYSLLIKGKSGTGKTILSLSILRALQKKGSLLYISTRTSRTQLFEAYPWIEEIFGPHRPGQRARYLDEDEWETLVDARLDEPGIIFERITNALMDKNTPTIVIDSLENLSDALAGEALQTNLRVLETWRERSGARFIFVGQDAGASPIDSMVQGMAVLKKRTIEGRRLREINLSKLQGVRIDRPNYFFTLENGMFRAVPGFSSEKFGFPSPPPASVDMVRKRVRGRFSTGYPVLDGFLHGGYPVGSDVSLVIDTNVESRLALVFLSKLIREWLAAGDPVVLQPPTGISHQDMVRFSKSLAGVRGKELLRVLQANQPIENDAGNHRILAIVGSSTNVTEGRGRAGLTISISRSGEDSPKGDRQPAAQLVLIQIEGTLFIRCDVPWLPLIAVFPATKGGNPMIELEPVV